MVRLLKLQRKLQPAVSEKNYSGVIAHELTSTIIEKFHGFIDGVEDNPVLTDGSNWLYLRITNLIFLGRVVYRLLSC